MRTVAWLAREGGFRGLFVDPEDYGHVRQFRRRAREVPFEERSALVRRRAREAFVPVFEECINPEKATRYKAPVEGTRLERMRRDLIQATDVSDGYVWFWGEKRTWVPRGPFAIRDCACCRLRPGGDYGKMLRQRKVEKEEGSRA